MYNHKEIEKKWQKYWEENKTFKVKNDFSKPKYYTLDMFPYPSWAGLHVWHPEWMTANDIVARYKNACWYNVLHPMWWDAFWLPAENYAIKTWTHPRITTDANIDNFRRQIKELGFSYDWSREIDTTDPKYFKWTQWIFLKLFENGLAYEQDLPINYCPHCKTSVANEEVLNDFTHERCGTKVEKKKLRQWVLAITKYADRLAKNVDKLDWPDSIKEMQKNWIGKSEGCEFEMKKSDDETKSISVYTTRIDTVFGMTYAVLAPDHKDVMSFITPEQKNICIKYIDDASKKSDQDRTIENKEKTWVFTGSYVINPFNGEQVPLWIWDYVLGNYGTWAVMAVPANDERDFEFAKKYDLLIIPSIFSNEYKNKYEEFLINKNKEDLLEYEKNSFKEIKAYTKDWYLVWNKNKNLNDVTNCFEAKNNLDIKEDDVIFIKSSEARSLFTKFAEENGFGKKTINYKLRDWLFSRQRYWWEPIPLIHLDEKDLEKLPTKPSNDAWIKNSDTLMIWDKEFSKIYDWIYSKIVCDYRLPLELPEVENFEPAWDGNSPLARVDDFVNIRLAENLSWKRETNTMPQWGWSCWYYLRYMDTENPDEIVNKEVEKYWGQVDSYVWWAEHAVLHLLYARFWHKFLYDIWVVSFDEPFFRLRNQWLILAHAFQRKNWWLLANDLVEEKEGKFFEIETWLEVDKIVSKMSKSLKNVVNPDEIVEEFWADSLRLYEMYMAEFKDSAPWDSKGIIWVRRFIEKSERLFTSDAKISTENDNFTMKLLHKTIKKVEEDINNYKFNTAIAALMILVNNWLPNDKEIQREFRKKFLVILNPFAPHLAEELWERMNKEKINSIHFESWPKYDPEMIIDDTIKMAVQVLWKVRWEIEINKDETSEKVLEIAKNNPEVQKWIDWKEIVKEIYVPGRIINIVVK